MGCVALLGIAFALCTEAVKSTHDTGMLLVAKRENDRDANMSAYDRESERWSRMFVNRSQEAIEYEKKRRDHANDRIRAWREWGSECLDEALKEWVSRRYVLCRVAMSPGRP